MPQPDIGHTQFVAQPGFLIRKKPVEFGLVDKPMLIAPQKDTVSRQQPPLILVLCRQMPQIDAPAFESQQRLIQIANQPHDLAQRFAFDDRSVGKSQARSRQAQFDELLGHLLGRLHVARLLALHDTVEGRLGDVDAAIFDERTHVPEHERQQQRADVAAVDIGVSHENDFAIPPLTGVFELTAGRDADGLENGGNLFVVENLHQLGFFDVENLSTQRKDGLGV